MSGHEDNKSKTSADEQHFFEEEAKPGPDDSQGAPSGTEPDPMGIERRDRDRVRSRSTRYQFLGGAFVLLSLLLLFLLRGELVYFFRSGTPEDLGTAEDLKPLSLADNSYVKVQGIARDLCVRAELLSTKVRYLYLLGSEMGARILVQAPVGEESGCLGAEDREFAGRVVDLSDTRRFNSVLAYYREHFPTAPREGAMYLLLDGERPRSAWVYPAVFAVLLLMVGFNIRLLWRLQRKPAVPPDQGDQP